MSNWLHLVAFPSCWGHELKVLTTITHIGIVWHYIDVDWVVAFHLSRTCCLWLIHRCWLKLNLIFLKLRCLFVKSWCTFTQIMLTTAILHNDHFIDLLLFYRMSFHGLEHFVLVSIISNSIVAGAHSATLWIVNFPCCLRTTEVASILTLKEIVSDNLLFFLISWSGIFNSWALFLRFTKIDMHMVLRTNLIHVFVVAHLGKALTLFNCWLVELGRATVEWLLITVFKWVFPLLKIDWHDVFIYFVGGNLLTFYIFWLTVIC